MGPGLSHLLHAADGYYFKSMIVLAENKSSKVPLINISFKNACIKSLKFARYQNWTVNWFKNVVMKGWQIGL